VTFLRAAPLDALWIGESAGVTVGGRRVVLVNVEGEIRAYEDRCAHQAYPLSRGRLDGRVLTCALHEWKYDATTGASINPRGACLRRFAVQIRGDEVMVDVDAQGPR
jgi:toluene monooxygenase system ferredoxin subunit